MDLSIHEKKILYYSVMIALAIILVIGFPFMTRPGVKTAELADDWPQDSLYVSLYMPDESFTPIFIAPDGKEVQAKSYVSLPYATYVLDTSDQHTGTWKMKYPTNIRHFTYTIQEKEPSPAK